MTRAGQAGELVETTWTDPEGLVHRVVLEVFDPHVVAKLRTQRALAYVLGRETACGQEIEGSTAHVDPAGTPTCALTGCDGEPPRHPLASYRVGDAARRRRSTEARSRRLRQGVA